MLEVARALSLSWHVFAGSSLEWSYNPYLTSIAPGGFVGLSRLQYLDLRNNAITGVVDWSGLAALTYVPHSLRMDLNGGYQPSLACAYPSLVFPSQSCAELPVTPHGAPSI